MNLTLNPNTPPLAPSAARRAQLPPTPNLATVYTRGGQTLRVPLRPAPAGWAGSCAGHPELQLMRWLQRRAAAEPGFPVRVRSVLLIVRHGGCSVCQERLHRFLNRFRLGTRLRLVRPGFGPGGCTCGCGHCPAARRYKPRPLLLDELLSEAEMEGEGWWEKLKSFGRTAALTGALVLGPQVGFKPVYDMAKAAGSAYEERRKRQQAVDDNTSSGRPTVQELSGWNGRAGQAGEYFAGEFEGEFEDLTEEQTRALQRVVTSEAEQQRQALYGTKTKPGRSGDPVKAQVNRNVGAGLVRLAKTLSQRPDLLARAAHHGVSAAALAQALKAHGNWLVGKARQSRHKGLELF